MRTYGHNDMEQIHKRNELGASDAHDEYVAEAQKQAFELGPNERELADGLSAAKNETEQETVIEKFLKGFKGNE